MTTPLKAMALVSVLAAAACSGASNSGLARQCGNGLASAYKELDYAKAKGTTGNINYGKAASLLAAAKVQQQFEKYPNCVDKVKRARHYIARLGARG